MGTVAQNRIEAIAQPGTSQPPPTRRITDRCVPSVDFERRPTAPIAGKEVAFSGPRMVDVTGRPHFVRARSGDARAGELVAGYAFKPGIHHRGGDCSDAVPGIG